MALTTDNLHDQGLYLQAQHSLQEACWATIKYICKWPQHSTVAEDHSSYIRAMPDAL